MNATTPTLTQSIQPRGSFTCPPWCVVTHTDDDLSPWEYGQWLVRHKGETVTWWTAHGSQMEAKLSWTEVVGSSPILLDEDPSVVEDYQIGPRIELGGDDGSGFMGVNEIVATDLAEWFEVLDALRKQVEG